MKKIFIPILFALSLTIGACSKDSKSNGSTAGTGSGSGQGGSLARYTIAQGYLYMVDAQELKAFSLANPADPQLTKTIAVGQEIETIFVFQDKLFIGSQQAMFIYSIANPASPQSLGEASHVRACDPVIANDSISYVTVRSGTTCGSTTNALYVYNIENILNPLQRNVIPLSGPWGLGMKDDRLYVCDGGDGLKVYNITNPIYPSYIKKASGIFYDVIVDEADNLLFCMIEGGVAIYDISNDNMTKLSTITN